MAEKENAEILPLIIASSNLQLPMDPKMTSVPPCGLAISAPQHPTTPVASRPASLASLPVNSIRSPMPRSQPAYSANSVNLFRQLPLSPVFHPSPAISLLTASLRHGTPTPTVQAPSAITPQVPQLPPPQLPASPPGSAGPASMPSSPDGLKVDEEEEELQLIANEALNLYSKTLYDGHSVPTSLDLPAPLPAVPTMEDGAAPDSTSPVVKKMPRTDSSPEEQELPHLILSSSAGAGGVPFAASPSASLYSCGSSTPTQSPGTSPYVLPPIPLPHAGRHAATPESPVTSVAPPLLFPPPAPNLPPHSPACPAAIAAPSAAAPDTQTTLTPFLTEMAIARPQLPRTSRRRIEEQEQPDPLENFAVPLASALPSFESAEPTEAAAPPTRSAPAPMPLATTSPAPKSKPSHPEAGWNPSLNALSPSVVEKQSAGDPRLIRTPPPPELPLAQPSPAEGPASTCRPDAPSVPSLKVNLSVVVPPRPPSGAAAPATPQQHHHKLAWVASADPTASPRIVPSHAHLPPHHQPIKPRAFKNAGPATPKTAFAGSVCKTAIHRPVTANHLNPPAPAARPPPRRSSQPRTGASPLSSSVALRPRANSTTRVVRPRITPLGQQPRPPVPNLARALLSAGSPAMPPIGSPFSASSSPPASPLVAAGAPRIDTSRKRIRFCQSPFDSPAPARPASPERCSSPPALVLNPPLFTLAPPAPLAPASAAPPPRPNQSAPTTPAAAAPAAAAAAAAAPAAVFAPTPSTPPQPRRVSASPSPSRPAVCSPPSPPAARRIGGPTALMCILPPESSPAAHMIRRRAQRAVHSLHHPRTLAHKRLVSPPRPQPHPTAAPRTPPPLVRSATDPTSAAAIHGVPLPAGEVGRKHPRHRSHERHQAAQQYLDQRIHAGFANPILKHEDFVDGGALMLLEPQPTAGLVAPPQAASAQPPPQPEAESPPVAPAPAPAALQDVLATPRTAPPQRPTKTPRQPRAAAATAPLPVRPPFTPAGRHIRLDPAPIPSTPAAPRTPGPPVALPLGFGQRMQLVIEEARQSLLVQRHQLILAQSLGVAAAPTAPAGAPVAAAPTGVSPFLSRCAPLVLPRGRGPVTPDMVLRAVAQEGGVLPTPAAADPAGTAGAPAANECPTGPSA
ncbi:hypothetical protein PAPYR_5722 [Paratrimastix pyriformis]|uniref:Nascent polypeptide-associated complex subunit alpha, muscle-specific form-like n=1 Tax=Paratrimastix pyriformis TaxID=342808 RepID=A0ABQ8UM03_9EUKA|nr:hypothetical protein PAPYR_5722 [Paratrimastix pyriformis]